MLRDFLVWYKNRDVVPFHQTFNKQFVFYRHGRIDMFKDGISVLGLTRLYVFDDLPTTTHFMLFDEVKKDLHHLVTSQVVGGHAIVFARIQEADVTMLQRGEYAEDVSWTCRSVVGYEANGLYLWALTQEMTGWYTRRSEGTCSRPVRMHPYGCIATDWLS